MKIRHRCGNLYRLVEMNCNLLTIEMQRTNKCHIVDELKPFKHKNEIYFGFSIIFWENWFFSILRIITLSEQWNDIADKNFSVTIIGKGTKSFNIELIDRTINEERKNVSKSVIFTSFFDSFSDRYIWLTSYVDNSSLNPWSENGNVQFDEIKKSSHWRNLFGGFFARIFFLLQASMRTDKKCKSHLVVRVCYRSTNVHIRYQQVAQSHSKHRIYVIAAIKVVTVVFVLSVNDSAPGQQIDWKQGKGIDFYVATRNEAIFIFWTIQFIQTLVLIEQNLAVPAISSSALELLLKWVTWKYCNKIRT